jgi:hypothetical protein
MPLVYRPSVADVFSRFVFAEVSRDVLKSESGAKSCLMLSTDESTIKPGSEGLIQVTHKPTRRLLLLVSLTGSGSGIYVVAAKAPTSLV